MTLGDLRTRELALVREAGQLQHELRRVKDGIERSGGWDRVLESRAKQLTENIKICERELDLINHRRQQMND